MTHFVLDARTVTPHFPGIGRYVTNLARAIVPLLLPDERLTMLHDPGHPIRLPTGPGIEVLPVAASPFSAAQQWDLPRLLRRLKDLSTSNLQASTPIVYHSPYIAMPYWPGAPTLLTVYDLIPLRYPKHSTPRARLLIRWMTRLALRAADHVIAISDFTRRDFIAEYNLAPERITAIPLAADPAFAPQPPEVIAAVRRKYDLPERVVLYLGSNKPHKNLVRLVEAWQMADSRWRMTDVGLVIAGAWDKRYLEARQLAENLGDIHWLGPVPEADLPALYSAADVFVFPSLYEGFGLPVLEAMACATPVICSNRSSLPEVANDAALLVEPTDTDALAEALCRALSDDRLRAELQRRGLAQAARLSWTQTATATLALYRNINV